MKTIRGHVFLSALLLVGCVGTPVRLQSYVLDAEDAPQAPSPATAADRSDEAKSEAESDVRTPTLHSLPRLASPAQAVGPKNTTRMGGDSGASEAHPPGLTWVWLAYRQFRYEDALREAHRLVTQPQPPRPQGAMASVVAGAAAHLLGRDKEAKDWFRYAVQLDPEAVPDETLFPERVLLLYEQVAGGLP